MSAEQRLSWAERRGPPRPTLVQRTFALGILVAAGLLAASATAAEAHECLVVVLDTPAGLVDSTREMVQAILSSPVPIVVFVAPPGARAASAGVFVTTLVTLALVAGIVREHQRRVVTGIESQPGTIVVAESHFLPHPVGHVGTVRVHGEHSQATSAEPVFQADRLEIVGRDGLTLHVRPAADDGRPGSPDPVHPPQETAP